MTLVSLSQIEEAIEVMRSSFTYDPPERWRRAYDVLQDVRSKLRAARRPYAWLHLLGFTMTIGGIAASLGAFFTVSPTNTLWLIFALLVLPIPEAASWLVTALARREQPALRYQAEIESVCRPFDDIVSNTSTVTAT